MSLAINVTMIFFVGGMLVGLGPNLAVEARVGQIDPSGKLYHMKLAVWESGRGRST